jgi:hypothetical protein
MRLMGRARAKKPVAGETIEIRIYRLRKGDEIEYTGRATVPVQLERMPEQVGVSSRLKLTDVPCVAWDGALFKIEEEAGHPAVFLGAKDPDPPGMR